MQDLKLLKSQYDDSNQALINRIEEAFNLVNTKLYSKNLFFIDETLLTYIDSLAKAYNTLQVYALSNITNSSRPYLVISKEYEKASDYISLVEVVYNSKYKQLSHKDILGTLLSHNIKREFIGDIVKIDTQIYFEITNNLVEYIQQQIEKMANTKVTFKVINQPIIKQQNFKKGQAIIKSTRLDVIVKAITNLSRSEAKEYILANNVKVNQIQNDNYSLNIKDEDIISIKKYGRYKIKIDLNRQTKKGNQIIEYYQYQ